MQKSTSLLILSLFFESFSLYAKPSIVNGIPTIDYPAVVKLELPNGSICTASVIRKNILLTAAHCLFEYPDLKIVEDRIIVNEREYENISAIPHPLFIGKFGKNHSHDVAIIKLNSINNSFIADNSGLLSLSKAKPAIGDKVTMVGFGGNECPVGQWGTGSGTKRIGWNVINNMEHGQIQLKGREKSIDRVDGSEAIICFGDSGGPLISRTGDILGVVSTSGIEQVNGRWISIYSYYANLQEPLNLNFLKSHFTPREI